MPLLPTKSSSLVLLSPLRSAPSRARRTAAGRMAGLEEFQRAILLTFDPGADPAQRREANASLDALKAAAEGWRFCFQAFVASDVPQVKFWCLQTLVSLVSERSGERYVALPEPQKAELRASLVAWVQARGNSRTTRPHAAQQMHQRPCLPQLSRHSLLTRHHPYELPRALSPFRPPPPHARRPHPKPPRARAATLASPPRLPTPPRHAAPALGRRRLLHAPTPRSHPRAPAAPAAPAH